MSAPRSGPSTLPARAEAVVRSRTPSWWATRLHYLSLAAGFAVLLWLDRRQWFSGDEWDFLVKRGVLGDPAIGLFEPHNEHWTTGGVLVYRTLFSVFGVRSYIPYLVVLLLFQALAAHLLWRLMVRVGVRPMVATAAAAVFMVLGAGWENLINAFQMTFIGALAFGLLALLLTPERGGFQRRDVVVWIVSTVALTFSGVGLTMLVVLGATAFLRRGLRTALAVVSAPTIVYGLWYLQWGRHATAVDQQPLADALRQAPAFVWRGLVDAVDNTTGLPGVGPVLLVVLTGWLVVRATLRREPWPIVLTVTLGAPLFLFLVDVRRSGLGVASAGAPRYGYLVIAFLLPAAALVATELLGRSAIGGLVGVAITALLLLVALTTMRDQAIGYSAIKLENRDRIAAAADLVRSGARLLSTQPAPEFNPDLTVGTLRRLDDDGELPDVAVSAADRLTAREFLQLAAGTSASASVTSRPTVAGVDGATIEASADRPGCVTVTPSSASPVVLLDFDAPGSVTVEPSARGIVTTQLQRAQVDSTLRGRGRAFPVDAHQPLVVSVAATKPWLRLGVPATDATELCHLSS